MEENMEKADNKGLLATVLLLIGLFFLGYYGRDYQSDISVNILDLEDNSLVVSKKIEE
jgi:hypothetical protein